jgi:phosphoserine phosphatase RsbU/P
MPLVGFIAGDERTAFRSELARLRRSDRLEEREVCLRPLHGAPIHAALTATASHDVDSKRMALHWLVRDITARKRSEEAERRRLETALQHERKTVQTLTGSFPGPSPQIPGFEVASIYQPVSRRECVGGDYFDFIPLDRGRVGVVVGDVCGKGLPAAAYAAMTRYMVRAYAREDPEPRQVLYRVNGALYDEMLAEGKFVSLVYGVLDWEAATFTYANAGHPEPALYQPAVRMCEQLAVTGLIMALVPCAEYGQQTRRIERGDILALFTDGVTEAAGCTSPPDDGGVCATLEAHAGASAETIAHAIFAQALHQAGGELRDDVAIVVIRRT